MVTQEQILEALRDVEDPEVNKSIVELEMVRDINIKGSHVSLEVVLTIRGCPLRTTIENAVQERLLATDGIDSVDVKIGNMTDEERARFTQKLRGKPAEAEAVAPLLDPNSGVVSLAIASGKGGVGKSTVTANLARALARQGVRVGLVDADIYGFSIPGIFGLKDKKPTVIDDLIIPIEADGVKLMSMHFFVPENNPVVWRGPMLGKMLRNFLSTVHWGDLDVLILDLPPGTGDMALDVHNLLPKSKEIIVTTPQSEAADVAVRAGVMGLRTNHDVIGVVENMAYYECPGCGEKAYLLGQGGGERVAQALRTNVISQIPMADMTKNRPLFDKNTTQYEIYEQLAQTVMEKTGLVASGVRRASV